MIDIRRGTKGGRGKSVERLVPVSPDGMTALERAAAIIGKSLNLIPEGWTYPRWYNHAHYVLRKYAPAFGLSTKFHDLRASYVCAEYRALTGHDAPVVAGSRSADKALHEDAGEKLASQLGHGRRDVLGTYYGSSR